MLEAKRKQEAAVQKETLEQLDVFRKRREEAERKALEEANAGSPPVEAAATQWVAGGPRKRKKGNERDGGLLKGVKLRRASSSADTADAAKKATSEKNEEKSATPSTTSAKTESPVARDDKGSAVTAKPAEAPKATTEAAPKPQPLSLSLGYASSDEDDQVNRTV